MEGLPDQVQGLEAAHLLGLALADVPEEQHAVGSRADELAAMRAARCHQPDRLVQLHRKAGKQCHRQPERVTMG